MSLSCDGVDGTAANRRDGRTAAELIGGPVVVGRSYASAVERFRGSADVTAT
jgi:hypothetical protein